MIKTFINTERKEPIELSTNYELSHKIGSLELPARIKEKIKMCGYDYDKNYFEFHVTLLEIEKKLKRILKKIGKITFGNNPADAQEHFTRFYDSYKNIFAAKFLFKIIACSREIEIWQDNFSILNLKTKEIEKFENYSFYYERDMTCCLYPYAEKIGYVLFDLKESLIKFRIFKQEIWFNPIDSNELKKQKNLLEKKEIEENSIFLNILKKNINRIAEIRDDLLCLWQ